jgi:phosphoribosyl-ATP pyrophosphohydrolase
VRDLVTQVRVPLVGNLDRRVLARRSRERRTMMAADEETVLQRLYTTIASRRTADPGSSYTAKLLHQGRSVIAKKMGEEAVETAIAAVANDSDAVVSESADLVYHLLVLWADCGIEPDEVWKKLAEREGTSGLAEKAARPEV